MNSHSGCGEYVLGSSGFGVVWGCQGMGLFGVWGCQGLGLSGFGVGVWCRMSGGHVTGRHRRRPYARRSRVELELACKVAGKDREWRPLLPTRLCSRSKPCIPKRRSCFPPCCPARPRWVAERVGAETSGAPVITVPIGVDGGSGPTQSWLSTDVRPTRRHAACPTGTDVVERPGSQVIHLSIERSRRYRVNCKATAFARRGGGTSTCDPAGTRRRFEGRTGCQQGPRVGFRQVVYLWNDGRGRPDDEAPSGWQTLPSVALASRPHL